MLGYSRKFDFFMEPEERQWKECAPWAENVKALMSLVFLPVAARLPNSYSLLPASLPLGPHSPSLQGRWRTGPEPTL